MEILDTIKQPIKKDFELFQKRFLANFETTNPLLKNILDYVARQRGKQMRPIIILLSAQICGKVTECSLLSAVALELLHTATLIHDDIVDESMQRRGHASINAKWNNKIAVLAGDYILAKSIEIATMNNNPQLNKIIANLGQSLSAGELLQLTNSQCVWLNEEDYFQVIGQKTAQLFATCTEAGAISVNATKEQQSCLRRFGELLGLCFQLKDDLLDFSDHQNIGKPTMNDVQDGKLTLPFITAMKNAPEKEQKCIKTLIEKKNFSEENLDAIRRFVVEYKGIEATKKIIEQQKLKAESLLDFFPDSETKNALLKILNYTITRIK